MSSHPPGGGAIRPPGPLPFHPFFFFWRLQGAAVPVKKKQGAKGPLTQDSLPLPSVAMPRGKELPKGVPSPSPYDRDWTYPLVF